MAAPISFRNLDWGSWLYGIMSGFIGGGSGSITGGIVVAGVDPTANHSMAMGSTANLKVMMWLFVVNGIISAAFYLHQNPAPAVIERTTTVTVKTTEPNPEQH